MSKLIPCCVHATCIDRFLLPFSVKSELEGGWESWDTNTSCMYALCVNVFTVVAPKKHLQSFFILD